MGHHAPSKEYIHATAMVGKDFIGAIRRLREVRRLITPKLTYEEIRLVKGSLRKGACKNRATTSGAICGSVWEVALRTITGGKTLAVKCLGCGEQKAVARAKASCKRRVA